MKKAFPFLFFIFFLLPNIRATNYYFSSDGNDANTIEQAQNPLTPWKSLQKLDYLMTFLKAGDSILFKRGDIFSGSFKISKSGLASAKIVIGSYGTGPIPEISGFATLSNWKSVDRNLWKARYDKPLTHVNNFFIDGNPQQIGRFPDAGSENGGYLTIQAHRGKNQITAERSLKGINCTGGEIVVRSRRWVLDRSIIQSQQEETINLSNPLSYEPMNAFGFFIQNNKNTLNQEGEWYYEVATQTFFLYSKDNPNRHKIQVGVIPSIVNISKENNIVIENISLNGAAENAVTITGCSGTEIKKIQVKNSGVDGVVFSNSNKLSFIENNISGSNNNGVNFNYCYYVTIKSNIIKNTALKAGMGLSGELQCNGLVITGSDYQVEQNVIDSVGYNGIYYSSGNIIIKNNLISNFCLNKDDGGGIYTYLIGKEALYNQKISSNIIMNGKGAPQGTPFLDDIASGIYLDDRSSNIVIEKNTIFHCGYNGIYVRNSNHIKMVQNIIYDNHTQIRFFHDTTKNTLPVTGCEVYENVLVSKKPDQFSMWFSSIDENAAEAGTFRENYYLEPSKEREIIAVEANLPTRYNLSLISLSDWKKHYEKSPDTLPSPVHFNAYLLNKPVGSNLISNADYNHLFRNLDGWSCWSTYNTGKMELDEINKPLGLGLKLTFKLTHKSDSRLYLYPNNFPIKRGYYILKFLAKSNKSGQVLSVNLRRQERLSNIFGTGYFALHIIQEEYVRVFKVDEDDPKARIDFELSESKDTVWIGNVRIYEASITPDNCIKLEFNSQSVTKAVHLDSSYTDLNNKTANEVKLGPFSSVILFNKSCLKEKAFTLDDGMIEGIKPQTSVILFIVAIILAIIAIFYRWRNHSKNIKNKGSGSFD